MVVVINAARMLIDASLKQLRTDVINIRKLSFSIITNHVPYVLNFPDKRIKDIKKSIRSLKNLQSQIKLWKMMMKYQICYKKMKLNQINQNNLKIQSKIENKNKLIKQRKKIQNQTYSLKMNNFAATVIINAIQKLRNALLELDQKWKKHLKGFNTKFKNNH